MSMQTQSLPKNYTNLIKNIKTIVAKTKKEAQSALALITINSYWQIGQALAQVFLTPSQLHRALNHLTQDLPFDQSQLSRFYNFYTLWPDGIDATYYPNVTWSHYRQLLTVESDQARDFYLTQIQDNAWPARMLSQKIKDNAFVEHLTTGTSPNKHKTLRRSTDALHIYKGTIYRIVDGDTLMVDLDLGFDVWVRKRLRLRGVNTEELNSNDPKKKKRALDAKIFLEALLPTGTTVVIQTFKVDMYGRFVADVFYKKEETDKELIFKKGTFVNAHFLKSGLATAD